jgi:hypothetical protein
MAIKIPNGHEIQQNGKKYQMAVIYVHQKGKKYQMAMKYTKRSHPKAVQNIPKLSFLV